MVDTLNRYMVAVGGDGKVQIMNPPRAPMTKEEALALAAWLVALADTNDDFRQYLAAVQSA